MGRRRQDAWARRAKREGYAARSVYKLEEMDRRYRILARGDRVLDLGCAPGSWMRYAAETVGPRGRVIGVDLAAVMNPPPNARAIRADVHAVCPEDLGEPTFEVVVSDLAPSTTGMRDADHHQSMALARRALELAQRLLVPGGRLVVKVYDGPGTHAFLDEARALFRFVKTQRPHAVRSESREVYAVCLDRRPPSIAPAPPRSERP